jgi:transcriptional regulator with XRE-family HTH domain
MKNQNKRTLDLKNVSQTFVAEFFEVTSQAIGQWACPRNNNKNYDLKAVVLWKIAQVSETPSERADLEREKLALQCEKLKLEIEDTRKNTVTTQFHREFLAARAADLKDYLMGYGKMNLHEIAGQPIEACQKYWDKIIRGAMNTYVKNRS